MCIKRYLVSYLLLMPELYSSPSPSWRTRNDWNKLILSETDFSFLLFSVKSFAIVLFTLDTSRLVTDFTLRQLHGWLCVWHPNESKNCEKKTERRRKKHKQSMKIKLHYNAQIKVSALFSTNRFIIIFYFIFHLTNDFELWLSLLLWRNYCVDEREKKIKKYTITNVTHYIPDIGHDTYEHRIQYKELVIR